MTDRSCGGPCLRLIYAPCSELEKKTTFKNKSNYPSTDNKALFTAGSPNPPDLGC